MRRAIYIEGGGDSKDLHIQCRKAFRQILENCGFKGRMPRLVACGSRNSAYKDFRSAVTYSDSDDYIAILVDSEDPVDDIHKPWQHLNKRDGWEQPDGTKDSQAFLMITCMETWIAAERDALRMHYKNGFNENRLPSLDKIEMQPRHKVQKALEDATRNCKNKYSKGRRSFEILEKLSVDVLTENLLGFKRFRDVLEKEL